MCVGFEIAGGAADHFEQAHHLPAHGFGNGAGFGNGVAMQDVEHGNGLGHAAFTFWLVVSDCAVFQVAGGSGEDLMSFHSVLRQAADRGGMVHFMSASAAAMLAPVISRSAAS